MNEIILSICIPTYNRGHRAFELVDGIKDLLEEYENIEIIVSDNGSTKHMEGYDKIEKMGSERLRYHRFEENQFFWGNINQVLKMARGVFALLISDEDILVKENVGYYLELCRQSNGVSIIRTKTPKMYYYIKNDRAEKGIDGIKKFYMNNNYMSGIIYNRKILTDEVINRMYNSFQDNIAYRYYPHMAFDGYLILNGDLKNEETILVREGEEEKELADATDKDEETDLLQYATYESRLAQQRGFVEMIKNLWCATEREKAQMFMKVCEKTIFLLGLVKDDYAKKGVAYSYLTDRYREQCLEDIEYLDLPVIRVNMELWKQYVDALVEVNGE